MYQLYIRSFSDRNGDGVGDLDGVTDRLDHIAQLGVDAIWLNPCYPSPNHDGGYDVADYTGIDPMYGGLPAFEKLLSAAHERGIRVLMDLVPNHCSDLHPWFTEALAAPPDRRRERAFTSGTAAAPTAASRRTTGCPPSAARRGRGSPTPAAAPASGTCTASTRPSPTSTGRTPRSRRCSTACCGPGSTGAFDGFRVDVADSMVKHPGLPDAEQPQHNPYTRNQPGVHEIFTRWRAIADGYRRDLALIGEVWLPAAEAADYIRPGRLYQVFFFDLMLQPWDARSFRDAISATIASVPTGGGVATWTLNNHDVHRAVSRYGLLRADRMDTGDANAPRIRPRGQVDVGLGIRRARAAVLLLLALPGSAYLYQGEELGLPEVLDLPADARRDPIWIRSGGRDYGRDGSRVPLPWEPGGPSFGFSPPGSKPPWLPQPEWYRDFAASAQLGDPASTLTLYRTALGIRRSLFGGEEFEWLDAGRDDVIAFRRGDSTSVTVMGDEPFAVPPRGG